MRTGTTLTVVTVGLLVFAIGLIWSSHVVAKLRNGRKGRATGLLLSGIVGPMVVSGYAIQVSVADGWRTAWIAIHLVTSLVWILALALHIGRCYLAKRRERIENGGPVGIDLAA